MKKRAFTLIELLIVIAIIAILATIIIVALSNARPKAAQSAALGSLNTAIRGSSACIAAGGVPTVLTNQLNSAAAICATQGDPAVTGNWPGALSGYTSWYITTTAAGAITIGGGTGPLGAIVNTANASYNITCSGTQCVGV